MRRPHRLRGQVRRLWSARSFTSDASVIVLAAAVVVGALRPVALPVAVPVVLAAGAGVARRPLLVVALAPLLAGTLAHQAIDGAAPAAPGRIDTTAALVSDPDDSFGAVQALARADGHRYQLHARGAQAGQLRRALAGEVVSIAGRVGPRRPDEDWLLVDHVVGHVDVERVALSGRGDPVSRAANTLRRLLDRGAEPLEPRARALFTGFVLGDDRFQDPVTVEDFRATGLSHLLAVSGQNVAFALVVVRPLLARVGLRPRFVLTLAAVGAFALLTRFEPSVLRATAMAAIAALGTTLGRPITSLRVLALAVAGLVLIDPLLVRSLGFSLSVAASAGIILGAPALRARLPGPRALAELVSVTIAAQGAVAPLLVLLPGGVPLAAVPANLLAVPAAGPLMVWGLTAGPVAGVLGGVVARVIHLPTTVLLWWVAGVSARFAMLPVGHLGAVHVAVLAAVALGAVVAHRFRPGRRWPLRAGLVLAGLVLASTLVPTRVGGPRVPLGAGAELWLADAGTALVVIDGRADAGRVLAGLRAAGVRALDVVVSRTASRGAAGVVRVLADRLGPRAVIGPAGLSHPGAAVPEAEMVLSWPGIDVLVRPDGERLVVDIRPAGAGVASSGAPSAVRSAGRRRSLPAPVDQREVWLGARRFAVEHRALVMGILNRTPDSFYDAGSYWDFDAFLGKAADLVAAGADLLDVGGVKAGPGEEVGEQEELDRVVPAVEALAARFDVPLSVDTWRASVAGACFAAGAVVGNDISGFADPDYLPVAAAAGASVVATHIRLAPRVPDPEPHYDDVVSAVREYLVERASRALAAGIPRPRIMVDAGLDLGKTEGQSAELLRASDTLADLGFTVLLSASNKRFLWKLLDVDVRHAGEGTMAAHALGIALGCRVLRSHDVAAARRVADIMAAVLGAE